MSGAPCPDCGVASTEDYGDEGLCHRCYLERLSELDRFKTSNTPAESFQDKKEEDEEKDDGKVHSLPRRELPPTCPLTDQVKLLLEVLDEESDLYTLLEAWLDGRVEPVDVSLVLPARAGDVMRGIAAQMQLLFGLRFAIGEYRPLPYSLSFAIKTGLAKDPPSASKALRKLVSAGVVRGEGALPAWKGRRGVKTYAPPAAAVSTLSRAA